MSREASGIPRLPAYRDAAGDFRVWCAWCSRWHIHGSLDAPVDHRVAHCHRPDSPYRYRGYLLELHEPTAAILEAIVRGTPPPDSRA